MTEVKVDEVFRLMCDKASKVAAYDAVPCGTLSAVELLLDILGNVLLDSELLHSRLCDFNSLLLHFLTHVGGLDLSILLVGI